MTRRTPHPAAARIRSYVEARRAADVQAGKKSPYSERQLSADALGNPTQLSGILRRLDVRGRVGEDLLVAIAEAMGSTLAALRGEERGGRLDELEEWPAAVADARQKLPFMTDEAFYEVLTKVAEITSPAPPPFTGDVLVQLIVLWSRPPSKT